MLLLSNTIMPNGSLAQSAAEFLIGSVLVGLVRFGLLLLVVMAQVMLAHGLTSAGPLVRYGGWRPLHVDGQVGGWGRVPPPWCLHDWGFRIRQWIGRRSRSQTDGLPAHLNPSRATVGGGVARPFVPHMGTRRGTWRTVQAFAALAVGPPRRGVFRRSRIFAPV